MPELDISLGERSFRLACDDGQEQRLKGLADQFSTRVAAAKAKAGDVKDTDAIVLAALALLDEYDEAKAKWSAMTPEGAAAEWAADRLDEVSARIEALLGDQ